MKERELEEKNIEIEEFIEQDELLTLMLALDLAATQEEPTEKVK